MSLPAYLAFDGAADHGHLCPECDDQYPCVIAAARCAEGERFTCNDCFPTDYYLVVCGTCELYAEPRDPALAGDFAAAHDDEHHGGTPTVTVHHC